MGWDMDGKELDEVVITPEPKPEPDINDGWYWDDEDDAYVPSDDPITIPEVVSKIMKSTNMKQAQLNKLEAAITDVKKGSFGIKVYNDLLNNNKKLSFTFSTFPPEKLAFFDSKTNSIYFNGENNITSDKIIEELIHAVQYNIYYGNLMSNEHRNFEFEAKVLKDIDCYRRNDTYCALSGEIGMDENEKYCEMYEMLVYDSDKWNSEMQNLYNTLCEIWNQYPGDFDKSISPKLIENYLK